VTTKKKKAAEKIAIMIQVGITTDEEDLQIAAQQQFQEQCFLVSMLAAKHPALYNGRSQEWQL
jgi:hypothetical protein